MADYERPILAAEEKFFNECNTEKGWVLVGYCQCHDSDEWGAVPVIAVLTKADALKVPAIHQLITEQGLTMKEAVSKVADVTVQILSKVRSRVENELSGSKYPPKDYVSMSSRSLKIWYDNYSNTNMIMQI